LQPCAERVRQLVKFVLAVDFDGFARGIQCDQSVLAFTQVQLQIRAQRVGYGIVDVVVKFGEKFRAGH